MFGLPLMTARHIAKSISNRIFPVQTEPPRNPRLRLSWLDDKSVLARLKAELGVLPREVRRLFRCGERFETSSTLFGKPFLLNSPFWYLHGLKEIFLDQTYRFLPDHHFPKII